ncbi:MAG: hypothetical protein IJC64_00735 [Clostridia bacterium]|nr:hypothetical protein [Clostridia bacterium]
MKKNKIIKVIIVCVLVCAMTLGGVAIFAQAGGPIGDAIRSLFGASTATKFPSETNSFVKNYLVGATDQDSPFFETVLPAIAANIEENNKHSITKYYDEMPVANNPENFQGLGSTTYANINGKTVTAEAFYRLSSDSLHDPNCGMGLLIYQCIQYKLAHKDEDVEITFSSYRTSATASVCVIPESRYYGYMRSLYGTNYDEHGFVRISYMLVEAARMGIKVTMVNQYPSYAVKQYNPNTGKTENRAHINFVQYFNAAAKTECYDEYAKGKKVSDFLNCVVVKWAIADSSSNMQHVKSCTVSNYLDRSGQEHGPAIFFTSSNLDENNYRGRNGNGSSQSGVIISDHDELYRIVRNYTNLMIEYQELEQYQEFWNEARRRNEEQLALIQAGREDEIPRDEQILYLGSETDPVFELYFTPFGGGMDVWNTESNPISKYVSKLPTSKDYIEYFFNVYSFGATHYLAYAMTQTIEMAYCNNPNPQNKIGVRATGFQVGDIMKLKLGKEIGHRSINTSKSMHSKDMIMSYDDGETRHYVSIMTSCNFGEYGFYYRTNSALVIHETDETGSGFYYAFGHKYSDGALPEKQ